jgi:site-specific recombinase XerC
VGDVFAPDGKAKRRVALRVFKRHGQKPGVQEVLLPDGLQRKLERFWSWKAWAREDLAPDSPLFVSLRGTRLSTRQVRHSFAVWQRRAGFDRRLGFHTLRHSACTAIYRSTKDIRLTQRFARHTSVLTTAIYTHPTEEDLLEAVGWLRF